MSEPVFHAEPITEQTIEDVWAPEAQLLDQVVCERLGGAIAIVSTHHIEPVVNILNRVAKIDLGVVTSENVSVDSLVGILVKLKMDYEEIVENA